VTLRCRMNERVLLQVMRRVDRAGFVRKDGKAYDDAPSRISAAATISAPHMHAHALERLAPHINPGARVLDVGSGSGYMSVALALMAGEEGFCVGIDVDEHLVRFSQANVQRSHPALLEASRVRLRLQAGDGWAGLEGAAPFDAIHVGAAAVTVPDALVRQLAPGGRMIIPVGPDGGLQQLLEVDKLANGKVETRPLMGVRYVPLVGREHDL
jgi:protein-L-isoaspartate(D-aspartate) O-methyltransferase